ncbi:MAG: amidase domain-containing protein, partial [Clostridia bacterium]
MKDVGYNRAAAVNYAKRWALSRNPLYYSFDELGGDCTGFISQAVYAGAGVMNYTPTFGWYYISPDDRAPAWTGVEFFYNFFTSNEGA